MRAGSGSKQRTPITISRTFASTLISVRPVVAPPATGAILVRSSMAAAFSHSASESRPST